MVWTGSQKCLNVIQFNLITEFYYITIPDLHAVHGLSELVQLMCRAESLQANISQLHLFLPELTPQLHHCLRLAVQTLRQSIDTHIQNEQIVKARFKAKSLNESWTQY